jgi:hypothetical protein
MANDRDSTGNLLRVAFLVCLMCGIVVSATAVTLRPLQEENRVQFRHVTILRAAGIYQPGMDVHAAFERIERRFIELESGEPVEMPADYDPLRAARDPAASRPLEVDPAGIRRLPDVGEIWLVRNDEIRSPCRCSASARRWRSPPDGPHADHGLAVIFVLAASNRDQHDPQSHAGQHPHHRPDDDHRLAGDPRGPVPAGVRLRHQPPAVGVRRADHHQLHRAGPGRGLRLEQPAVGPSVLDGIGNGLGYSWCCCSWRSCRELFGSGTLFGMEILPLVTEGGWYVPNGLMLLPPSPSSSSA